MQKRQEFESTKWNMVLEAGDPSSPHAKTALEDLCQRYWYPLYAYVRRRGYGEHDAQDLTQEFFSRMFEKNLVGSADPERGRFRSFLLTSMQHFLSDQWDKARAQKRGGGVHILPFDSASGESRYCLEPTDGLTPEKLYEREWTAVLIDTVISQLREEYVSAGKRDLFERLKDFVSGERTAASYADVGRELNISEGAARVAAHRLRKRYGSLFRAEIEQTVASPADVEDEVNRLLSSLDS